MLAGASQVDQVEREPSADTVIDEFLENMTVT